MTKVVLPALALISIMSLASCGGDSPNTPSQPQTPQPTVLNFNPTVPGLASGSPGLAWQDVNVFQRANMSVTLQWTNGSKDLDMFVTDTLCQPTSGNCPVFAKSDLSSGTREQLSVSVQANTNYRIYIVNYGSAESTTLQAVVTGF
jgi:hypothetical protein